MSFVGLPDAGSLASADQSGSLVFEDPKSRALLETIKAIAADQAPVFVAGEAGTGKELSARLAHQLSPWSEQPFLTMTGAALSRSLEETDFLRRERRSVRAAGGGPTCSGTLFLEELADLSPTAQVELLRLVQDGRFLTLALHAEGTVQVRLLAASSIDLEQAVAAGRFHAELCLGLNASKLSVPPLRERPLDILPLARHFLELHSQRLGLERTELSAGAATKLVAHGWPSNVRELEHVMHGALLRRHGIEIAPQDLRFESDGPSEPGKPPLLDDALLDLFQAKQPNLYERIEEAVVRAAFRYCERNQLQTARLLGISRNIVRARLIRFGQIRGSLRSSSSLRLTSMRTPANR